MNLLKQEATRYWAIDFFIDLLSRLSFTLSHVGGCFKQTTDGPRLREAPALSVFDQFSRQPPIKLSQPLVLKLRRAVIAEGNSRQTDPVTGFC